MDIKSYPEYASIEKHIRAAGIERVPAIANALAGFIAGTWTAIQAPPAVPAIVAIDRRRESRQGVQRWASR